MPVEWDAYLARYHTRHPGITERLLNRARAVQGRTPYERLVDSIPAGAANVLDIACGSAPVAGILPPDLSYVGVDISQHELLTARKHNAGGQLVLEDGARLPFRDGSFDVVLCSMALMLMRPVRAALAEIRRVSADGGTFSAMFPAVGAPAPRQLLPTAALLGGLRTMPKFPQNLHRKSVRRQLLSAGFRVTNYRTVRYELPLESRADATEVVDGLYLPGTSDARIDQAKQWLGRIAGHSRSLPLHITYVTAVADC